MAVLTSLTNMQLFSMMMHETRLECNIEYSILDY